jgi:hypothetical protein
MASSASKFATTGSSQLVNNTLITGQGSMTFGRATNNGTISASLGTLTISLAGGGSITNAGVLRADGGTLQIRPTSSPGTLTNTGGIIEALTSELSFPFNGNPYTVTGGEIRSSAAGSVTLGNTTLQNVLLSGNIFTNSSSAATILNATSSGTIAIAAGNRLGIGATINNTGTISNAGIMLVANGTTTLTGGGNLLLSGTLGIVNSLSSTLISNNLLSGSGVIGDPNNLSAIGNLRLRNSSTITATAGSLVLATFNAADGLLNTGTLRADGGTLVLMSPINNTGGVIEAVNGSTVSAVTSAAGTVTISGGTLRAASGGTLSIHRADNVVLDFTDSTGRLVFASAGTNPGLTNAVILGDAQISTPVGLTAFINGATINNLVTLSRVGLGPGTLTGAGTVTGTGIAVNNNGAPFTNRVPIYVTGPNGMSWSFNASGASFNQGILHADAAPIVMNGTVNNTGGLIELANAATLTLNGALIGGTITASNDSKILLQSVNSNSPVLLSNVTFASSPGSIIGNVGSANIAGTITALSDLIIAPFFTLGLSAPTTFAGPGAFVLQAAGIFGGVTGNFTLTNNTTIRGNVGLAPAALINNGTIDGAAGSVTIFGNVTNNGLIIANASAVTLSRGGFTGGTYSASGSTLFVGDQLFTPGTLTVANGLFTTSNNGLVTVGTFNGSTVILAGANTNTGAMRIYRAQLAGTLTNTGTVTLAGSSTIDGGTLTLTATTSRFINAGTFSGAGTITGAFTNTGLFTSGLNARPLVLGAGTSAANPILNSGALRSDNGSVSLTGFIDNTGGIIESRNLTTNLVLPLQGPGGLRISNATLTGGSLGFTNGNVQITNSILSDVSLFGSMVGSITISSGTINLTNPITLFGDAIASAPALTVVPTIYFNSTSPNSQSITTVVSLTTGIYGGSIVVGAGSTLTADQIRAGVTVQPGARLILRPFGPDSPLTSLVPSSIAGTPANWTGTADIADYKVRYLTTPTGIFANKTSSIATFASQLASGYHNGDWLGTGITSSTVAADNSATGSHLTTLALYDNADLGLTTFGGEFANSNSLFIATALIADANFDGAVDAADFAQWHAHALELSPLTNDGDFNHDGGVDGLDFDLWFTAAGSAAQPELDRLGLARTDLSSLRVASVPEPASGLVLVISPWLLLRRGRRREGRGARQRKGGSA